MILSSSRLGVKSIKANQNETDASSSSSILSINANNTSPDLRKANVKHVEIAIIMGSKSDYNVMKDAEDILKHFNISHSVLVVSAHRTPQRMYEFAKNAKQSGIKVIIAGAGGAAHLPGMVSSLTTLPVIGVPVKTHFNDGLDSLLSIVQMPFGVPVATMSVNGAKNAALFAISILAIYDFDIEEKLNKFKINQTKDVPLTPFEDIAHNGVN
jgi:5-(carboxyamino)imidazole ribonucleotide mutase